MTDTCRGKFAATYVGLSRAQTIDASAEEPHYNGLTLLGHPLRTEHFVGGLPGSHKRFAQFDLINDEYRRLRELDIGKLHTDDRTLL